MWLLQKSSSITDNRFIYCEVLRVSSSSMSLDPVLNAACHPSREKPTLQRETCSLVLCPEPEIGLCQSAFLSPRLVTPELVRACITVEMAFEELKELLLSHGLLVPLT